MSRAWAMERNRGQNRTGLSARDFEGDFCIHGVKLAHAPHVRVSQWEKKNS